MRTIAGSPFPAMRYSMCTPSGSVASSVEPFADCVCSAAVVAAVSVEGDAAGALGAVFLLQADSVRAARIASVVIRPRGISGLRSIANGCMIPALEGLRRDAVHAAAATP